MEKAPEYYMNKALRQAETAGKNGEVPVGAVVVLDGKIVGSGCNSSISRSDPTAHAEILALRKAARKTKNYRILNAEVYVTLEPCLMCYSALVNARVRRLFVGALDEKAGVFSTGIFRKIHEVYNHKIDINQEFINAEASELLKTFFKNRRGAGAVERDGLENR